MLDIKARGRDGALYNIEIQNRAEPSIRQRLAYYGAELYTKQLAEGEDYGTLLPAITICFLSEKLFRGTSAPHSRFTLFDSRQQLELTSQLQIHTIELGKYNFNGVALDRADSLMQWAFFLANAAEMEADSLRQTLPGREFAKATGVVEMIAQSPEERQKYLSRLKAERDHRWRLRMAEEQGREQGREEGRQEAECKGLVRQIRMMQGVLKLPVTPEEELAAMELANLSRLCDELENKLPHESA